MAMQHAAAASHDAQGAAAAESVRQLAGKYMTFKLADEAYGLPILKVREIIGLMEITRVPRTPDFIRGVINLRDRVVPVVDLRLKFGMPRTESSEQTVIIVVQYATAARDVTRGILVDQVLEVLSIASERIEPPPSFAGDALDTSFLLGVGKTADRVIFLLDIGRVLSDSEAQEVVQAARG